MYRYRHQFNNILKCLAFLAARLQSEDYPLLAVYKLGAVVLFFAATVCVVIQGSASLPLSHGRAIICVPASVLSPWKL